MRTHSLPLALAFTALISAPVEAQQAAGTTRGSGGEPAGGTSAGEVTEDAAWAANAPDIGIQHYRPQDQRGVNVFEAPKTTDVPFTGFKLELGAAFATQFQALDHSNTAAARAALDAAGNPYDANQLMDIGAGFNLPTANLYLNAQLAPGIRVALASYLSSRHHEETWVKDGYLLIDGSPIDHPVLNRVMDHLTIKAGLMELNYGDAHFRRTDNAQAMYNPFVGNYILDSFTTEPGMEVYVRGNGLMAMGGVTSGVNKGDVTNPDSRGLAYLAKLGFDRHLSDALRVRLTGSLYTTDKSPSVTLFGGDRAGSRYYLVVENTQATTKNNFTSGLLNPGFRNEITAIQVNPFVKFRGLELFGMAEQARGKAANEAVEREWNHYAADVVYRFLPNDRLYVGGRYNSANGELNGVDDEVSVDRVQLSAGWFITPTILLKGEYANQKYHDFPAVDIRNGAMFDGFVFEGVVAF